MIYLQTEEIPPYLSEIHKLTHNSYPEFLSQGEVTRRYWDSIYKIFPQDQRVLVHGSEVVAVGNSIPLFLQDDADFAESGWDWALKTGVEQHKRGLTPNTLVGLSVGVSPAYRGHNLSSLILEEFKQLAKRSNFSRLVIPIRPTRKAEFPDLTFDEYLDKKHNGTTFDPWIRIHEKLGACRICVARASMRIEGDLECWNKWTGMSFPSSGKYHLVGGLAPLQVDLMTNQGKYIEPNLWMEHDLSEA